jgi:hypothetical protein
MPPFVGQGRERCIDPKKEDPSVWQGKQDPLDGGATVTPLAATILDLRMALAAVPNQRMCLMLLTAVANGGSATDR